jgi:hypothetical protein
MGKDEETDLAEPPFGQGLAPLEEEVELHGVLPLEISFSKLSNDFSFLLLASFAVSWLDSLALLRAPIFPFPSCLALFLYSSFSRF